MTTIAKGAKCVTSINVFTVEPESATARWVARARDRYVGAACAWVHLLRSSSQPRRHQGDHVRAVADDRGLRSHAERPSSPPYLQEALTIAKFEPGLYEVVESFAAPEQ
jgi:hypothetical protein